jgi:mRNA-degrading endonuclease RelE of RelBE toxin-antitoxin system
LVFRVLLHSSAAKALKKLDAANGARMRKALGELTIDPWKAGTPLRPSDFWSIRAGAYRAIYEVDANQNRVIVLFIGNRKKCMATSKLLCPWNIVNEKEGSRSKIMDVTSFLFLVVGMG